MQFDFLLAVENLLPGDPAIRVARPKARSGQDHGHGRQGGETVGFLEGVAQLVPVQRIGAKTEAKGVQDAVLGGVALLDLAEGPGHQLVIINRHWRVSRAAALRSDPR